MTPSPEIKLRLNSSDARHFYSLLSKGFRLFFEPGCSIADLLSTQLKIEEVYVNDRIQTIFLNGKAVDDIRHAIVTDGSTLALSAAMPGLAGAVFRTKSRYSAMRESISYSGHENESFSGAGVLELKLFNLVAREIGDIFLSRGILVSGRDISRIVETHADFFGHQNNAIWVCGKKTDAAEFLSSDIKTRDVFLKILPN